MDASHKFAVAGDTMDFALKRILEGHFTPPALFTEIIVEKCQLINHHFLNTRDHLRVVANVNATTAKIILHNTNIEDSALKVITIINAADLEQQLTHLWTEVQLLLKFYHENDRIAELTSIDTYYRSFAYNRMIAQHFIYEFY